MDEEFTSTLNKNIAIFGSQMRRQIDIINELTLNNLNERDAKLYNIKAVLFTCLIDTMAKCIFNSEKNRDRFLKFIGKYCDWEDCNRISLPQLNFFLCTREEPEFDMLKAKVSCLLNKWPIHGNCNFLSIDPQYSDLFAYWPSSKCNNKHGKLISLENFDHKHMLWYQRNGLVHESKRSGYAIRLFDTELPHYIEFLGNPGIDDRYGIFKGNSYQLYYPIAFYKKLVEDGLINLEKGLLENRIDPYGNVVNYTHLWLDLNY